MGKNTSTNYGISIHGSGSLHGDAIAVGPHASATATSVHGDRQADANMQQIRKDIDELQSLIGQYGAALQRHTEVADDVAMARAEAQRPEPRTSIILDIVKRVSGAAQAVTPVVELANKITLMIAGT